MARKRSARKGRNWFNKYILGTLKAVVVRRMSPRTRRRVAVLVVVGALSLMVGAALAIHHSIMSNLPRIAALKDYKPPLGTRVYSEDDHLIGSIKTEKGIFVPLANIPDSLRQAVIAVEDARFYKHEGLDYQGIMRAIVRDLAALGFKEGGSTLTQQLAKVMFLTQEKSIVRKVKEAVLATQMENRLTKDEILELYLNKVYFGRGSYGVEAASRSYFGKHVGDLNIAESAMMAGLLKAPNNYSPYIDFERSKARQEVVLARMVEEGFISQGKADEAKKRKIVLKDLMKEEEVAPHLIERIRVYLEKKYGMDAVYQQGLRVNTTINFRLQKAAQKAVESGVAELNKREGDKKPGAQAALVAIDPRSGKIRAVVGGPDFKTNEYNHAMSAERQPGSSFKPFVYAAAMDDGYNPASIIVDEPKDYDKGKWTPENYEHTYNGPTSLRVALSKSLNVVTVELLNKVGTSRVIELAKRLGMDGPFPKDLTLALGSCNVKPVELTAAYCAFANGGTYLEPYYISRVRDASGKVLETGGTRTKEAMSPVAAYQVTSMLVDAATTGTGRSARYLGVPVAGKTGTTNNYVDAWFVGYTPALVAGVWVGNDNYESLGKGESGARAALPIWMGFMRYAVGVIPGEEFIPPEGVVFAEVDAITGLAPTDETQTVVTDVFREGEQPGGGASWFDSITPEGIKELINGE